MDGWTFQQSHLAGGRGGLAGHTVSSVLDRFEGDGPSSHVEYQQLFADICTDTVGSSGGTQKNR